MGIKNPDILIPKLDDLNNMFQKWNYIASDIVNESERLQINSSNSLSQQKQRIEINKNLVQEDGSKIEQVRNEVNVLKDKCNNELIETQKLLSETKKLLFTAETNVAYWEKELDKAIAWLEKAKERLKQAELEYKNAKIQLQLAKDELERAEQALHDCESSESTDKDGNTTKPDCSFEKSWVRKAQRQVSIAYENLRIAEKELNDAKKEVSEATQCANLCEEALKLASKALSNAKLADNSATTATLMVERSIEECNSASNSTMMAEQKLILERELINNADALISKALIKFDESTQNNKEAINCTDSAQNYGSKGIQDLSIRLDFLRKFASPINFQNNSKQLERIIGSEQNEFLTSFSAQSFETKNNLPLAINNNNSLSEKDLIKSLTNVYSLLSSNNQSVEEIKSKLQNDLNLLSLDPVKNEKDEYEGELGLLSQGVFGKFKRDESGHGDFISVNGFFKNKIFDVFGIPNKAINYYKNSLNKFFKSTDDHFHKILSGKVDYLIIDVRAMNYQQKNEIESYINNKWMKYRGYLFWIN
jgi:hypothetical protein